MKNITVQVRGITPLLMNNPQTLSNGSGNGVRKIPTPEVEAASKVYRDGLDRIVFPVAAFRGALVKGASGRRIGKLYATTVFAGTVFAVEEYAVLVDPDTGAPLEDYEIDRRRVVIKKQGIIRSRPKLPRWATEFQFEIDEEIINDLPFLQEVLDLGGRTAGVGDFRPEKKGPFGRFEVLSVEEAA